ncbi:protein adenylyltransferase SelO [Rhodalgimonas zhirmunskyi]|uniref:Protein nucleotidyltransferase YdiU n=1 Tax=Rhodalgimonas zhirmunskyi TaxID=2964767 RepID=A0AAJ1UFL2_9RHOB|nr:YdiU family protein [Rhodoalgimonas zhirmunskyi]MDQ2095202.1 YdiU family protein [Rhodoalgimonas zhirmunskyi]
MTLSIPFANSYTRLPPRFFTRQGATPVANPTLIAWNAPLAAELGLPDTADATTLAQIFSGNTLPEGSEPLAQVYAGHQFGGFSPQLGDGRALLLGDVIDTHGTPRDIQLKGAGRTVYSRGGDGRAWLGPVLREYVVSEAMHALGVPTTRALAAVATGEMVFRETALPGAVLTRVAASHIRVGTFQYFAARGDTEALEALFDYTRTRHYPQANTPEEFLDAAIDAQVRLVTHWLSLGFIHGVMNTDNTALSGETIDYGPCAFIDAYHPQTVFSSIDRRGRYAYDNQANIIAWNMAQLASCLVPLCPDEDAAVARFTAMIHGMADRIAAQWLTRFAPKLGLTSPSEDDRALITDLLDLMAKDGADFTNTFRALAHGSARDQLTDRPAYDAWHARWKARLARESDAMPRMRAANPAFIPRNHRVEQMIQAAVAGDYAPFHRLNAVLAHPYEDQPDAADLTRPPAESERVTTTFCGT